MDVATMMAIERRPSKLRAFRAGFVTMVSSFIEQWVFDGFFSFRGSFVARQELRPPEKSRCDQDITQDWRLEDETSPRSRPCVVRQTSNSAAQ
jgi:hypothetical protein